MSFVMRDYLLSYMMVMDHQAPFITNVGKITKIHITLNIEVSDVLEK